MTRQVAPNPQVAAFQVSQPTSGRFGSPPNVADDIGQLDGSRMNRTLAFRESRLQAGLRLMFCLTMMAVFEEMLTSDRLDALEPSRVALVRIVGLVGALYCGVWVPRWAFAIVDPGSLSISVHGITQDLGWRVRRWCWTDITDVRIGGTVVPGCLIYPVAGPRMKLFGWNESPGKILEHIARYRSQAYRSE